MMNTLHFITHWLQNTENNDDYQLHIAFDIMHFQLLSIDCMLSSV